MLPHSLLPLQGYVAVQHLTRASRAGHQHHPQVLAAGGAVGLISPSGPTTAPEPNVKPLDTLVYEKYAITAVEF